MDPNQVQSIVQAAFMPVCLARHSAILVLCDGDHDYSVALCKNGKIKNVAFETIFAFAQLLDKFNLDETRSLADLLGKVQARVDAEEKAAPQASTSDAAPDGAQDADPESTSTTEEN